MAQSSLRRSLRSSTRGMLARRPAECWLADPRVTVTASYGYSGDRDLVPLLVEEAIAHDRRGSGGLPLRLDVDERLVGHEPQVVGPYLDRRDRILCHDGSAGQVDTRLDKLFADLPSLAERARLPELTSEIVEVPPPGRIFRRSLRLAPA